MRLHPAQDVVEDAHGVGQMRALVEHHALGPLAHRRVGDLGARRRPGLGEFLEDLGGPDDRDVPRLAHPQDLLLHLGEALVPAFHGEVPAGDHDADRRVVHGREKQARQPVEPRPGLDLEDDAEMLGPEPPELRLQGAHVLGPVHERETDHVGMTRDDGEILDVLRREAGKRQRTVRQIDPFVSPELAPVGRHVGDPHPKALGIARLHDPTDLAVIEPDALPGPHVREDLWRGTRDRDRPEERAVVGVARRSSRSRIARDDQQVAGLERQERCAGCRTHLSNSRCIEPGSVAPPLHGGGLAGFSRARANRIARPCGTLLPTIAAYLLVARSEPRPATRGTTSRPKDWKNRSLRLPSNENAGASPAAKRRGTRHARFISVTTTPANAA
jgi:hypothetical protein